MRSSLCPPSPPPLPSSPHSFDGDLGYAPRVMHRAQTLVVVCNTLVSQWQREISKFTGGELRWGDRHVTGGAQLGGVSKFTGGQLRWILNSHPRHLCTLRSSKASFARAGAYPLCCMLPPPNPALPAASHPHFTLVASRCSTARTNACFPVSWATTMSSSPHPRASAARRPCRCGGVHTVYVKWAHTSPKGLSNHEILQVC